MNILFLGGNRYFGKIVLKELLKKNHNIYLLNRNSDKKKTKHKNLVYLRCDRKNLGNYKYLIKGVVFDKVFDNIAYKLEDVINLHNILKKQIKHYIFTSSVITYLNMNDGYEAKEKDWFYGKINKRIKKKYNKNEIKYAINKKKIERYLLKNKKINSTILRIPAVLGKNDFSFKTKKLINYPYEELKRKKIFLNDYIQFIFKDDLVKIIVKLIEKKINKTNVFNIANNKIKIKSFYEKLYKIKKSLKKRKNNSLNYIFPIPINSLMNCDKIKKNMSVKFSTINKVLNSVT